ncbi:hypothetical protein [Leifsonia sp. AG29]|uniref:hypothetical protein n=1 Tax=Leifsonia sp. AG29 TaxID=2598860 RepID=UPI00131ED119|nr:hypothetical protein [Leifsonia sp. AG29]
MNGDVMGGGVIVAIAAALWLAYLVPVWLRRREFVTTERNAVRLQQTLRILAETSELPEAVRVEATARTVAEQQRILRRSEEKRLAEARAEAAAHARREQALAEERRLAAEEAERAAAHAIALERAARAAAAQRARVIAASAARPVLSPQRRRRLRRARALSTFVLLAGATGLVAGIALRASGAWPILVVSAAAVVGSTAMLVRLARARGTVPAATPFVPAAPASPDLYDHAQHELPVQERLRQSWTPQPLPKPLHLSPGTVAAAAMASVDAAAELRRAAARSEFERRAAQAAPAPAVPLRPVAAVPSGAEQRHDEEGAVAERDTAPGRPAPIAAPAPAPSRFASMGILDELETGPMDLDAVLRRRRAAS